MATNRVRTGCLKCRVRRRKCDEGKPRCRRCISSNFECQYGTRLSFLPKNSLAIDSTSCPSLPNPSSYSAVQFVTNETSTSRKDVRSSPEHAPTPTSDGGVADDYSGPATESTSNLGSSPVGNHELSLLSPPSVEAQLQPLTSSQSPFGLDSDSPTPSRRYNDALDALLSLRSEDAGGGLQLPLFDSYHGPAIVVDENQQLDELLLRSRVQFPGDSFHLADESSEERVLTLLKHWRYEVAPWLDICDLGHGFGLYVSRLATFSRPTLNVILSLSAASSETTSAADNVNFSGPRHANHILNRENGDGDDLESKSQVTLIRLVLERARDFILSPFGRQTGVPPSLPSSEDFCQPMSILGTLAYQLQLRLDLATALLTESALPVLPLGIVNSTPWHKTQLARDLFRCVNEALILCAQAVNFAYLDSDEMASFPGGYSGSWLSQIDGLNSWYLRRPQEFQSIIELDNDEGIPVILFTNGAAIFANQLYHTALLLLLLHKPRTALVASNKGGPAMSFLWHARRICGMALSNDMKATWDPSLLASLVVAAKRMTNESQHEKILLGLDRIAAVTGWDLASCRDILQSEWVA